MPDERLNRGYGTAARSCFTHIVSHVKLKRYDLPGIGLVACCLVVLMSGITWFLVNIDRGLDMTDESLYMVSALVMTQETPYLMRSGFYNGMLLTLVGKDLVLLRGFGVILLLAAVLYLVASIYRSWKVLAGETLEMSQVLGMAAAVSAAALTYYAGWLITPSYNWFALFGSLLAIAGLLWLAAQLRETGFELQLQPAAGVLPHAVAVAVGIVIAFFSKPTSGAGLGVVVFLLALAAVRLDTLPRLLLVLGLVTLAMFALHLWFLEGGLANYIGIVEWSLQKSELFFSSREPDWLISLAVEDLKSLPEAMFDVLPTALFFASGLLLLRLAYFALKRPADRIQSLSSSVLLGLTLLAGWLELYQQDYWSGGQYAMFDTGKAFALLALLMLLSVAIAPSCAEKARNACPNKRLLLVALLLVLMPLLYAFGSSNGLLRQSSLANLFYALAVLMVLAFHEIGARRKYLSWMGCLLVFLASAQIVKDARSEPYRLAAPLAKQDQEVTLWATGTRFRVDQPTSKYIRSLQDAALQHGWEEGTPIIDMTGGTPAISLILGATPMGSPWLIGGYPGSAEVAIEELGRVAPELLDRSWILLANQGSRSLPRRVLRELGIELRDDYELVGEMVTGHRSERQRLWRPREQP